MDQFTALIGFLLKNETVILSNPINGDLWKIRPLFNEYTNVVNFNDDREFINYLNQFNLISSNSLIFNRDLDVGRLTLLNMPRLTYVNIVNVLILQQKIKGEYTSLESESFDRSLNDILSEISKSKLITSHDELLQLSFGIELMSLDSLLNKPLASVILSKQRARLKTPKLLFHPVCNDVNHSFSLASISLNKKEYNNHQSQKQNIPENTIHQKIAQNKLDITKDILSCYHEKIHFLPIVNNQTDLSLGDCSYLDTCHKLRNCRYLHYFTLNPPIKTSLKPTQEELHDYTIGDCFTEHFKQVSPPQWIECDVRKLPFSVLGKFAAIISDPAWDIHMSLPYSTCKDDELLELPMHQLQDEGIIMLWVTGRSIEIGRKALTKWGYRISDEMIWIKLNQLKRTIVTGRTGHWLNHSKEHLLVGIKGDPIWLNTKIDLDIVVSNTRETSRKPDEFYDIVERLVGKFSRKLEIFGRDHNKRPGWVTIGNQLKGTSYVEY